MQLVEEFTIDDASHGGKERSAEQVDEADLALRLGFRIVRILRDDGYWKTESGLDAGLDGPLGLQRRSPGSRDAVWSRLLGSHEASALDARVKEIMYCSHSRDY